MIQTHHFNYFYGKSYCVFNNVTFNNMVCYTNLVCLIKNVIFVPLSAFLLLFPAWYDRGTTLRAAPSKNYAFSTNYHACIEMPR